MPELFKRNLDAAPTVRRRAGLPSRPVQKIRPFLRFDSQAEEATRYASIIESSRIVDMTRWEAHSSRSF